MSRTSIENDFYLFSCKRTQTLLTVTLVVFALLAGCSWNSNNNENREDGFAEEIETSEQKLYKRAQGSLRSSNFRSAIEQLEQLESRFPFGRYAEQAQLELIYAKYMTSRLDELTLVPIGSFDCTLNTQILIMRIT